MKKITKAIENAVINWYANEHSWAGIEINGYPYIVYKHQVYRDGEWTTDDGFDVFPSETCLYHTEEPLDAYGTVYIPEDIKRMVEERENKMKMEEPQDLFKEYFGI